MMRHMLTFISVIVGVLHLLGIVIPQSNARIVQHGEKFAESSTLLRGKRSAKIIDGDEVVPHSLPYQVYLNLTTSYNSSPCGGSLISQKYVLTAAHCLDDAIRVQVILGAHNIEADEPTQVKLTVTKSIVHAGWDLNALVNDIALIELPSEVKLTEAIGIIQLPTRQEARNSFSGAKAKISGWGLTSEGLSPVLLAADLTVIDNTECASYYYGITTDSQVCATDNSGKAVCSGDSGGPLVELSTNKQIGVVSYTTLGCLGGYPSGYTRVGEYLDWIEENSDVKIL